MSMSKVIADMEAGNISPLMKRLGLEHATESKRILDHNQTADRITLDQNPVCEFCEDASEHVIPSVDGEDRKITCNSDACIDTANVEMDGLR